MESWWKTWSEVNYVSRDKKVILYGRSEDWLPKTFLRLRKKPKYIVDRNTAYENTEYRKVPVVLPEKLMLENRDDVFIIVTAGEYEGIITFLMDNDFEAGRHFCCCPEYRDYSLLELIRSYDREIIVSCSDYRDKTKVRYSRAGGGIYKYHIGPNKLKCLFPGSFRQMTQVGDLIYAIEYVDMKLCKFDTNFNLLDQWPLDAPNYCGLGYNEQHNALILINAGKDTISVHDVNDFKRLEHISYSDRFEKNITSQHHLNDVCVKGNFLYVSYFSHSGNWKKGVFDGGISEFNIEKLDLPPVRIVSNLWKPHSPKIIEGDLCFIDSMRGKFYTNSQEVAGEFPGFMRGLAHDGRFFFIGQSEDMYISQRFTSQNNIMLNAGIYMFDRQTKASRFYPMLDNMNVHDLMIIENKEI